MTHLKARTLEGDVSRILRYVGDPAALDCAPILLLTVGLPGSGKSTLCRRFALDTGAVVLESDALRRLLFTHPRYTPGENRRLFGALYAAAGELLQRSRTVIIDATNLLESDRKHAYDLAERAGARLHLVHFTAPETVIEERLRRRRLGLDRLDSSSAGIDVYRRMAGRAQPLVGDHWLIDSSDAAAADSIYEQLLATCLGFSNSERPHGTVRRRRRE